LVEEINDRGYNNYNIATVLMCLVFAACQKDLKNPQDQISSKVGETNQDMGIRSKPKQIEVNQAVILKPNDLSSGSPAALMMSSLCEGSYVLQIKRISQISGTDPINIRVFTKDVGSDGWSAVVNNIAFHTLSDTDFTSVLLFDGMDEICFLSTDNCAFIQPLGQNQDIVFEVRWFNVSGGLPTSPETVEWEYPNRYYFTMYPDDPNDCENLNPEYCCEYEFKATHAGTSTQASTMRFFSPWDNDFEDLNVPPKDSVFFESEYCGPIGVTWYTTDHETIGGSGTAIFECDDTEYIWIISEAAERHGVIFDPDGRLCRLRY
jgi:hypothetical protein